MPVDVIMPQMGESIVEGTITKWLKKPGDTVAKDEPLFEISTDKVDAEIPSPVAGTLVEIKAGEGETVAINTVVAVLSGADAAEPVAPAATTGVVEVVMPQMGESIVEGTITKWLKKPGDAVAKDEPLFEISTDKVDAEIPSPVAGTLTEIKTPEGKTVGINTVVALLASTEAVAAAQPAHAHSTLPALTLQTGVPLPEEVELAGRQLRSSPLVRRIAREKQLDLRQVSGSGLGGRITKEDILLHLKNYGPGSAPVPPADLSAHLPGELVPMTKMRTIIAQRMVESKRIAPHVHSVYKVDMTRIVQLRNRERAAFEKKHGVKLTYMPFIAAAMVEALRNFPILNASIEGNSIRYHRNINLGIAVALDWGLIVPVVKQAEARSFSNLARTIVDLAARARSKKLMPDETSGSTFTLTNSGVFGGEYGTPILNQPESAILAIGGMSKVPAVITDAEGNDSIAIRSQQYYCMGFDHRLIDGADSGKFMSLFKQILENWDKPLD
ncbi:2-oxo acid dehydrogenase subunit E2 [Telmatobacter bradus]|uniref:2-oxo acid dehydrogenase subunit E2 n=1 Tax=Telmatobacter bradus TaxID=474953 RepID=UPI003B429676